jgi:hypothetical protein
MFDIIITGHEKVATSLSWNAQRDSKSILAQVTQVIDSSRNLRSRELAQSLRTTGAASARLGGVSPPVDASTGEYPFLGGATPRAVPSDRRRVWDTIAEKRSDHADCSRAPAAAGDCGRDLSSAASIGPLRGAGNQAAAN